MRIEIYNTPDGEVMIAPVEQAHYKLEVTDREFITKMIELIKQNYTLAYKAACEAYKSSADSRHYYEFLIVRRFLKCNFGEFDNVLDFDNERFKFEFVQCPMRGKCKYDQIICNAKFNTSLSEREFQVMKHFYEGLNESQIADKLYISINTVLNHKKSAYRKTESHSLADFINYAKKNNLYGNS